MPRLTVADLEHYGVPLETFQGHGRITLSTQRDIECDFLAGQMENGKTILLCASTQAHLAHIFGFVDAHAFSGMTGGGLSVEALRGISETNYLPRTAQPGSFFALRVGHLRISRDPELPSKRRVFVLTNLTGIRSEVRLTVQGRRLVIRPLPCAAQNLLRLSASRGVLPTAELEIEHEMEVGRGTETADDVCLLLSIALGTRVQWISMTEWTDSSEWTAKNLYSRITKRYGVLAALDPRGNAVEDFARRLGDRSSLEARQGVGLTSAATDTYLDAKAEGDFLQVRALKLVIAIEMLKAAFQKVSGVPSLAMPGEEFEKLRPALQKGVKGAIRGATTAAERGVMYENLGGLNRLPFPTQIRRLCAAVGLPLAEGDVRRFVLSRNKLVHEGYFYCESATELERTELVPLGTPVEEWFWLLHFVDRVFLRAIGYEGEYIDWSRPGAPQPARLRPTA